MVASLRWCRVGVCADVPVSHISTARCRWTFEICRRPFARPSEASLLCFLGIDQISMFFGDISVNDYDDYQYSNGIFVADVTSL